MRTRIEFTDISTGKMYSSWEDFGLVIAKVTVGQAKVKKKSMDIPFSHGELDYTEFLGEPMYNNREIVIDCGAVLRDRFAQESILRNAIDGRKMKIRLSGDERYYYVGRVEIGDISKDVGVSHMKITCDCEPWKYACVETETEYALTDTAQSFIIYNAGRPVAPTITATAPVRVTLGGKTADVSAGTSKNPDLKVPSGRGTVSARVTSGGAGTLTLTYREMML